MDLVPHGDHEIVENHRQKKQLKKLYTFILTDVFATIIFLMAISLSTLEFKRSLVFWGILGGLLPDLLVALYQTSKIRLLKKFNNFHYYVHDYFFEKANKKIAFIPGLLLQLALVTFFLKAAF